MSLASPFASVVVGAAAGAAAAAVVLVLFDRSPAPSAVPAGEPPGLAALEQRLAADAHGRAELAVELKALDGRLASLEERLSRQALERAAELEDAQAREGAPDAERAASAHPAATEGTAPLSAAEFQSLMSDVLRSSRDGSASAADQERFWVAARTTGLVDQTIAALEASVKGDPGSAEGRMQLADAYVAKLLTVPAGPERGIWGMKAEKQWQTVVEQSPDHWDASYSLAFNYSMYPDFLNKTEDAIAGFERTLQIQERGATRPEHANTYLHLARMHEKNGDRAKAKEVLELGSTRHPANAELTQALARLAKQ